MITLAQAVWQFGSVAERQPQQVADALRVPLVVVEEVIANSAAGVSFGKRDITAFQVSPIDADGIDPAVVGYMAKKLEQWRLNFREEIAIRMLGHRESVRNELDSRLNELNARLKCLELKTPSEGREDAQ